MKQLLTSGLLLASILLLSQCGKDDYVAEPSPTTSFQFSIAGMVFDEDNLPLPNVTVAAGDASAGTDAYGTFELPHVVSGERCIVRFSRSGYSDRIYAFRPSGGTANYIRIVLTRIAPAQTLAAASGGTVQLSDGSAVQFPANAFVTAGQVPYAGSVQVTSRHLSPDEPLFSQMIPGNDLAGIDKDDRAVQLTTYGMLGVELSGGGGETLQLAPGTTATLTFPIAASQLASAPASIPLWYFDSGDATWKEQGSAQRVGNSYVGTVAHFSWWNCDIPAPRATISGQVTDCNGVGLPNVTVTFNQYCTLVTDQQGRFSSWVPAGIPITVQVLSQNNSGVFGNSAVVTIPVLANSQSYVIPPLVIPCPATIKGRITDCNGDATNGVVILFVNNIATRCAGSVNGRFTLPGPPGVAVQILATTSNVSAWASGTLPAAPDSLDLGDIPVCAASVLPVNSFQVSGQGMSNTIYVVNPTSTQAGIYTAPWPQPLLLMLLHGLSQPAYQVSDFEVAVGDTVPGTYTWISGNQFIGTTLMGTSVRIMMQDFSSMTSSYEIYSVGDSGTITLSSVGPVGGFIRGSFTGSCEVVAFGSMGVPLAGPHTITGRFEVPRDY